VEAIRSGINKVNIYTAMDEAANKFNRENFAEYGAYLDYTRDLTSVIKEVVIKHIALFAGAHQ
jgi:fructose/tagatose bisphosphate aldolase